MCEGNQRAVDKPAGTKGRWPGGSLVQNSCSYATKQARGRSVDIRTCQQGRACTWTSCQDFRGPETHRPTGANSWTVCDQEAAADPLEPSAHPYSLVSEPSVHLPADTPVLRLFSKEILRPSDSLDGKGVQEFLFSLLEYCRYSFNNCPRRVSRRRGQVDLREFLERCFEVSSDRILHRHQHAVALPWLESSCCADVQENGSPRKLSSLSVPSLVTPQPESERQLLHG